MLSHSVVMPASLHQQIVLPGVLLFCSVLRGLQCDCYDQMRIIKLLMSKQHAAARAIQHYWRRSLVCGLTFSEATAVEQ